MNWDDEKNFLNNPNYRGLGLAQLRWMWTTFHVGHYVPLSWMTLGLDYSLWGMSPAGYHLTNLLWHTANAVVFYFLACRLLRLAVSPTAGPEASEAPAAGDGVTISATAALAALLFAIHPLRVESVAWVTERRDVVSLFFYLLSVLSYIRSCERGQNIRRWFPVALLLFICALLSKATAMTLPALLLILNVYPLRRIGGSAGWWNDRARRVYTELAMFALPAAGSVVLSIVALHPPNQLEPAAKLAVSAYSLVFYLWKTIVPIGLSPLYEMPQRVDPVAWRYIACYAVVITLTVTAWTVRHRWPGATAALVAFVVMILPMLGAVQNGPQIAADRYTYHASPALAILIAGGAVAIGRSHRAVLRALATGALLTLGAMTWEQTKVWRDSDALWSRVLDVDPESSIGHSATARLLYQRNNVAAGIEHSRRALATAPNFAEAHNDLGVGFAREGNLTDAVEEYQRALGIKPTFDDAQTNMGVVNAQMGRLDLAIDWYRRALANNPENADAEVNWGNALVRLGKSDEAIGHYREALRIRPDLADAHHNWGVALAREGKLQDAIDQFQRTLAIDPTHSEAREYLNRATQALRK
ncbi:MAG: tetratricopeptide repeat protein [bacterium]